MGVSGGGPYVLACLSRLGKKIRAGVVVCGLGPMDTEDSAKGMNASNASLFYCARNYPGTVRFILRITKYMMTKKVDTYYRLMGKVLPGRSHGKTVRKFFPPTGKYSVRGAGTWPRKRCFTPSPGSFP